MGETPQFDGEHTNGTEMWSDGEQVVIHNIESETEWIKSDTVMEVEDG